MSLVMERAVSQREVAETGSAGGRYMQRAACGPWLALNVCGLRQIRTLAQPALSSG
jgi:hypothetical protein